jgi:hypothetical protein
MKRLGLAGFLLCALFLISKVFAHPTLNNFVTVFADTDGETLTGDYSGLIITNTSATGAQTFTLPDAVVGMHFFFSVAAAQSMVVDPQNEDQILSLTDAAGDEITSDTSIGTTVELVAIDGSKWLPIRRTGTWQDL